MSDFYCVYCGQRIFGSKDIKGPPRVLLEIPGYRCTCYELEAAADLSGLRHRAEEFLYEVWCCCRISVMRRNGEGSGVLVAYADSLVELPEGAAPPAPVPLHKTRKLGKDDFERVIIQEGALPENSDKLYVLKFTALWCPPCRIMDQVFRDIAHGGGLPDVEFFEVDSDEEQDLTERFLTPSVPYMVFFKGGRRLDASRLTLEAVNGGIAEVMGKDEFAALCAGLLRAYA
jgi:thiol-disulfide isomerase/thioredoxin